MKKAGESVSRTVLYNIKQLRLDKNYTQDYVAAKLKISQNAYSKIELGYSKLTLDRLIEIACVLDGSVIDLMTIKHYEVQPV